MCALGLREPRVEERLEPVERQMQRVQQQVGGLVVGVGRAVAEREPRPRRSATPRSAASRAASRARAATALIGDALDARRPAAARGCRGRSRPAARDRRRARARSSLWIVALTGPSSTTSRADVGDEAAVGRAAGARELRRDARSPSRMASRRDVDEPAARRQERLARSGPGEVVVEAVPREDRLEALRERFARAARCE